VRKTHHRVKPTGILTLHRAAEIIPSSARSAASSATPLPAHLHPLLSDSLERIKQVVHDVLPVKKRPTVLEEAEWEDEDDGSFAKEMMLQGGLSV
jgi:hypothetical protein